jgi:hypothetical protein
MATPRVHRLASRWLGAVALVAASAALAFVMPADAILKHLAKDRDDLRLFTLRVDGSASFFGDTAKEAGAALSMPADRGELQTDASVMFKVPGRCRIELNPLEGSHLAMVETGRKQRSEGTAIAAAQVALTEICEFLAARSSSESELRDDLARHLKSRKISITAETSLDRFGGQVTYVIGDAKKPGSAKLSVYKPQDVDDHFLPARITFADDAGVQWDVRFFDFSSPATGEWFPRSFEVVKNGELAMRFTALAADVRSKIDDKLF